MELEGDEHEQYLLDGIKNGFCIVDKDSVVPTEPVEVNNYASATSAPNVYKVEEQIIAELNEGNYVICDHKPHIVSALGAIDKPDGGIRLIHDASRPVGASLNDLATPEDSTFQSFKDVLALLQPNCYCAKVDLKAAYRSCGIRKCDRELTGLKWRFTGTNQHVFMQDHRFCFGARKTVFHFNNITQAVRRMMERRGFNIVVFIDDFLCIEKDFATCLASYNTLIQLLRSLGFSINWQKVADPTQCVVFLGIQINTHAGTLSLNEDKTERLIDSLNSTLKRSRLSKTQLQSIAGKLMWASVVTPWGKTHTCEIFRHLSILKKPSHKLRTIKLHATLIWWINCLRTGNHTRLIWDDRPIINICTDSSRPAGGAFCEDGDWVYKHWCVDAPHIANVHINFKELYMGLYAVARWAPKYPNHRLFLFMDNTASTHIINNGSSRCMLAIKCLRSLSLIASTFNVSIHAFYIPGVFNNIADSISRFYSKGQIARFISLLHEGQWPMPSDGGYWINNHMSQQAKLCISLQISKWVALQTNWTQRWLVGSHTRWRRTQNQTTSAMQGHFSSSVKS